MNAEQWLTSVDPKEMHEHIKDSVTERQMRFFVEAHRRHYPEIQWTPESSWTASFNRWCEWDWKTSGAERADLLREIVPFRPIAIDPAIIEWRESTIPRMARKIAGVCHQCKGKGHVNRLEGMGWNPAYFSCEECNGTGYIHEPHWDDLPLLADACEEAEVEASILDHFRGTEPCLCLDNMEVAVRRKMNMRWDCGQCKGTGYRKPCHVRGCWRLELFLQS